MVKVCGGSSEEAERELQKMERLNRWTDGTLYVRVMTSDNYMTHPPSNRAVLVAVGRKVSVIGLHKVSYYIFIRKLYVTSFDINDAILK